MRTALTYSTTERRRRHIGTPWRRSRDVEIAPQPSGGQTNGKGAHIDQMSIEAPRCADPEVRRVRDAGGPLDLASYSCQCGLIFSASVSTTVACPHCGTEQDW
jgi:hypothetical protein